MDSEATHTLIHCTHTANIQHVHCAGRTFHVYTRPDETTEFKAYADAVFYDEPRHDLRSHLPLSPKPQTQTEAQTQRRKRLSQAQIRYDYGFDESRRSTSLKARSMNLTDAKSGALLSQAHLILGDPYAEVGSAFKAHPRQNTTCPFTPPPSRSPSPLPSPSTHPPTPNPTPASHSYPSAFTPQPSLLSPHSSPLTSTPPSPALSPAPHPHQIGLAALNRWVLDFGASDKGLWAPPPHWLVSFVVAMDDVPNRSVAWLFAFLVFLTVLGMMWLQNQQRDRMGMSAVERLERDRMRSRRWE